MGAVRPDFNYRWQASRRHGDTKCFCCRGGVDGGGGGNQRERPQRRLQWDLQRGHDELLFRGHGHGQQADIPGKLFVRSPAQGHW